MIKFHPMKQHHYTLCAGGYNSLVFVWLATPPRRHHLGQRWIQTRAIECGALLDYEAPVILKCRGCGVELKIPRVRWEILRDGNFIVGRSGEDVWWRCEQCEMDYLVHKKEGIRNGT